MTQIVSTSAKARRDIQREWHYLLSVSGSSAADRFLEAVEQTSTLLLSTPGMGILCDFTAPRGKLIRRFPVSLPFGRWLMFYLPTQRGITVYRLAHGARDLTGLFGSGFV